MKLDDKNKILNILDEALQKHSHNSDYKLIKKLKTMINNLDKNININDLDMIAKEFNDLEIKYDDIFDLSYYFDPIYIQLKKLIHHRKVQELRKSKRKDIK